MIVDTHVHCWSPSVIRYPWLDFAPALLNQDWHLKDLEIERNSAGVQCGILVQAANSYEETDYLLLQAHQHTWIKGVVGWLDLLYPESVADRIVQWKMQPLLKGCRHLIHDEPQDDWLLQIQVLESLRQLADQNIPFDFVGIKTTHLEVLIKVLDRIPHLRVMIDHFNQPPAENSPIRKKWQQLLEELKQNPGVYMKLSGMGTAMGTVDSTGGAMHQPTWKVSTIAGTVEWVLDRFGEDRICCGSDWPVMCLAGNYCHAWEIHQQTLQQVCGGSSVGKEIQEKIFNHNAQVFYALKEKA